MPNWKQDRDMKAALITKGWHGEIDKWPPRIPYYRHKDGLNDAGVVCSHRGEIAVRGSSNLDHQERYANKGWFWFPPTEDCGCTWCKQWHQEQGDPVPALGEHPHHYAGRAIGSACTFAGCTMTRQTPFISRKKSVKPKRQAVTV